MGNQEDRQQIVLARGLGEGMNGEWLPNGYKVFTGGDEKLLKLDRIFVV